MTLWSDGFGRWYAAVPAQRQGTLYAAADAIMEELEARGELGPGYKLRLELAPDHWAAPGFVTYREVAPKV